MASVNQNFLDALIRHQVYLMRFSGALRQRVLALLDATEDDLRALIERRLENKRANQTHTAQRLRVLLRVINRVRGAAWDKIDETWLEELTALARYEPTFVAGALRTVSPVLLDLAMPAPEQLRAIVRERPFEGKIMREWAAGQRRDDLARISQQIQIGMVQGESSQDIARRVFGTRAAKGVDGVTELTRQNASALARTAVNHVSNAARRELYKANDDIFSHELYVATLDSRTTAVCRANDGKKFKVGEGPIPPLHWQCRSLRVAVIDGVALGTRPAKPVTEQMLLREYSRDTGIKMVEARDMLPRGHKAHFDSFARKRIRDMTGTVTASTTYQDWLARQSREFQDDVLGKTKGALFRKGGLTLDKFVNRAGDELTLKQLAKRHRQAFIDAGIDPEEYL
jgi:SPP1 gp7 family putative phage head morphogenesis protein